jgi:hypothetical protein
METLESPFQATACPRKGISLFFFLNKIAHTGIYNVKCLEKHCHNVPKIKQKDLLIKRQKTIQEVSAFSGAGKHLAYQIVSCLHGIALFRKDLENLNLYHICIIRIAWE